MKISSKTVKGIRQIVETSAKLSSRSYLRAVAEQHLATVNIEYLRSRSGEISEEQARQESRSRILTKTIGSSGYTYIIDSHGVLQSHPVSSLQGRDMSEWQFVKEQINRKNGFLEYQWQNPGDSKPREKVLYMDYFDPWDWIISVTAYRDELDQLINPRDFRDDILSMKIAEHGYPFVIDRNGLLLAHPTMSGNVLAKGSEYRDLFRDMISAQGRIVYDWTDPRTGEKEKKDRCLRDDRAIRLDSSCLRLCLGFLRAIADSQKTLFRHGLLRPLPCDFSILLSRHLYHRPAEISA